MTSEEWSDEEHCKLRTCTALEAEVQARVNAEYIEVVKRNVSIYRDDYANEIQERREKRRKRKANIGAVSQSWSMRRTTTSTVGTHPGASSSTDQQP